MRHAETYLEIIRLDRLEKFAEAHFQHALRRRSVRRAQRAADLMGAVDRRLGEITFGLVTPYAD